MFKVICIVIILVVIPVGLTVTNLYQQYGRVSINDLESSDIGSLTTYYFFIFIAATVFYIMRKIAAFLNREE